MIDRRKFNLGMLITLTIILLGFGCGLLYKYFDLNKDHYITYNENSDLGYDVIYKENNFFNNNSLEKNNKYIASLIDYIDANFKYKFGFNETNINYTYSYKIVAHLKVKDSNDNNSILYQNKETLYESNVLNGNKNTNINKVVKIDYNKYNDLISSFLKTYELKDSNSELKISMFVDIKSMGNNTIEDLNKKSVISLTIPLSRKTISIDLSSDLTKSNNRKVLVKNTNNYNYLLLASIVILLISLVLIIITFIYSRKTRTIKNIYDREIRKIINNYGSYIQRINSKYKIGTSQVIKVERFEDMLEIRDTLKTPILMLKNDRDDGTFFIIPATNGIIYTFALRMVDIIARKKGEEAPDYDLKNIDKEMPKKYTSEFIDKQIEETRSMKAIDTNNIIEGNKDKDEDIYEQLNKTMSMKPIEYPASIKKSKSKTKKKTKETK